MGERESRIKRTNGQKRFQLPIPGSPHRKTIAGLSLIIRALSPFRFGPLGLAQGRLAIHTDLHGMISRRFHALCACIVIATVCPASMKAMDWETAAEVASCRNQARVRAECNTRCGNPVDAWDIRQGN